MNKKVEIEVFKNDHGIWFGNIKNFHFLSESGNPKLSVRNFGPDEPWMVKRVQSIKRSYMKRGYQVIIKYWSEWIGTGQIAYNGKTHIINSNGRPLCERKGGRRYRSRCRDLWNDRYDLLENPEASFNCKFCYWESLSVKHPSAMKFKQF